MATLTGGILRNLRLGTVVSFRYNSPTAQAGPRMGMVMWPSDNRGNLHCLNVAYINHIHLKQIYWFFKSQEQMLQQMNPFHQEAVKERQAQEQAYQEKIQQQLQNQTGVVIKPQQNSTFGVKTFGPTPTQTQQFTKQQLGLGEPSEPDQRFKPEEIDQNRQRYFESMIQQKQRLMENPNAFYYEYVKPLLGGTKNLSRIYRKYSWFYIKNPRLVNVPLVKGYR